jgi:RNA 2',3'-cyclic 3'-phosphodiesterase
MPKPEQLPLAGLGPVPETTMGLFFGTYPDEKAAADIDTLAQRLRAQHGLKGRPRRKDLFHFTLLDLSDCIGPPERVIALASEAAATISMPSFTVALDHVVPFGRSRKGPLVLGGGDGVAALVMLHQVLADAMTKAGLRVKVKSYTPHLTLLYDRGDVARQPVETISWTVRDFVLVQSLIGQSKHVPLARWPLTPA